MPRASQKISVSTLNIARKLNVPELDLTKSSVSQGTSLTSGVTINSGAGSIFTLTTGSLATLGSVSFTCANSLVQTDSIVMMSVVNGPTGGFPIVSTQNITTGSFSVNLRNADAVLPISGSLNLSYLII